jgi:hypothetical protein
MTSFTAGRDSGKRDCRHRRLPRARLLDQAHGLPRTGHSAFLAVGESRG